MTDLPPVSQRSMALSELLGVLESVGEMPDSEVSGTSAGDVVVRGLGYDSRRIQSGDLFFALVGEHTDGHLFIEDAVGRGAVAVVVERGRLDAARRNIPTSIPLVEVVDTRKAMALAAATFYGNPSQTSLTLAGVTGTNGKTSTTYLLASIFEAAGMASGVVGTVEIKFGGRSYPAGRTTPEAPDLQRLLAAMVEHGVRGCALEVSSHALSLGRVLGCHFDAAVFTNLSQDHLDFHSSMEDYFEAKASLFTPEYSDSAAINISDEWGKKLAARLEIPLITYGKEQDEPMFFASDARLGPRSTSFVLTSREGRTSEATPVEVPLAGAFAVWNSLAAAAGARALGIGMAEIVAGLESAPSVPGRFETVFEGQDFLAVVDYAHTPDSLRSVLRSARMLKGGEGSKVVVVIGCGGDRDRGKRPLMGKAAVEEADFAIFTTDNPRSEDPSAIIAEIVEGARSVASSGDRFTVEEDRRTAIELAVSAAGPGDVVVVAGKGHETGQVFGDTTIPFDDRKVLAEALRSVSQDPVDATGRQW
jgi:UDP-N-acetylmuramoyl-L-alanyl-D-glutamate--2,6-diaminopimelate ligase